MIIGMTLLMMMLPSMLLQGRSGLMPSHDDYSSSATAMAVLRPQQQQWPLLCVDELILEIGT